MNDLISRQAVLAIANDSCLDLDKWEDNEIFCKEIEELPSADIMECARAMKKYCKYPNCTECKFAKHTEWHNGLWFTCKLHDPCYGWDLPEGEDK